ncbi:MAG: hypothetical protein J6Y82_06540 [Bacteroidales bacterium]|nr:hypothetical protein [Bacteroidales bacterium]
MRTRITIKFATICVAVILITSCASLLTPPSNIVSSSTPNYDSKNSKVTTTTSADGKTVTTVVVTDLYRRDPNEVRYITYYSWGNVVYSDGTMTDVQSAVDASKTPIAVIFDPKNKLGVALTEAKDLAWAKLHSTGYKTSFNTSTTSGKNNWDVIKAADPEGTSTAAKIAENYPAFDYCNKYSAKGYTTGWYLPARDELKILWSNKYSVNQALKKIKGAELIPESSAEYWSSSQGEVSNCVWNQLAAGNQVDKMYKKSVRAIYDFK